MNVLDHFSIPYKGLGSGIHEIKFSIEDEFFLAFDQPLIDNGVFEALLILDKRSDHSILTFEVEGYTVTDCDRCLESIKLPVTGSYTLHLKFSEEVSEEEEIVYLHPETSIINVAKYIYDVIGLSMPITKIYDCENDPNPSCNQTVLAKLGETNEIKNDDLPSPWDGLKGINFE